MAALLGGLVALERKAFLQAQIARPIVVGPLIGWALGDPMVGLWVGAPLELIWIGAANLGASLPPHETAATAAIVAAAVGSGAAWEGGAPLAWLVFAPVAAIGRSLEGVGERANEKRVERAAAALEQGREAWALRAHLAGLWMPFAAVAALTWVAAVAVGPGLGLLLERLPAVILRGLQIGWVLLWAVGAAAAVRAARLPNGWALAGAGAAGAAALWAGLHLLGGAR